MSTYLAVFSIGPVQEFIGAARRTRDLWAGSQILDAVSKAAAQALKQAGANLIFPHPEAKLGPDDPSIANIILTEVNVDTPANIEGVLAPAAKKAAQQAWDSYAEEARKTCGEYIHLARFQKQNRTVLEFNAAWLPLSNAAQYKEVRANLMRLLAGRKTCRNFDQFAGENGLPKSSLDGARESIWNKSALESAPEQVQLRLRLHRGEQLDAIGLVKRVGLGTPQFPSIPRIAADPWLRGLPSEARQELVEICHKLSGVLDGLNPERFTKLHGVFPFEGTAAFRNRLSEFEDLGVDSARLKPLRDFLAKRREPHPYCAVILADGDFMGKAISGIGLADGHRKFSKDLSQFSAKARKTVLDHFGCCVYAGGDDVLAFLPLDMAIECAVALRSDFAEAMKDWRGPTLSVGIAIGHNIENLEDLLKWARDAEDHAKKTEPQRNALAVHLHPRGGQPVKIRRQWTTGIHTDLLLLANAYRENLFPDGAAFELREMARHYVDWPPHPKLGDAVRADVRRVLARKVSKKGRQAMQPVLDLAKGRCSTGADLLAFAEEMIVARALLRAYLQSGRRPGAPV